MEKSNVYRDMRNSSSSSSAWNPNSGVDQKKSAGVEAGFKKAGEMPKFLQNIYSAISGGDDKKN